MRQLTEQERKIFNDAPNKLNLAQYSDDFEGGFVAGLDYQQAKFAALFQQLKGLLEMGASIYDASVKELENETTN